MDSCLDIAKEKADLLQSAMRNTYHEHLQKNASRMWHNPTSSELLFRNRLINAHIAFKSQVVIGRYIVDFVIPERMLIIELDGSIHQKQSKIKYDKARVEFLRSLGFRVLRIPNCQAGSYKLKANWRGTRMLSTKNYRKALSMANQLIRERAMAYSQRQEIRAIDRSRSKVLSQVSMQPRLIKQ